MALLNVLNTAISGLTTTQLALEVTSGNIANAGTEGYSRKSITLSAQGGRNADLKGVEVDSFSRATDEALTLAVREALGSRERAEAQNTFYDRLETAFGLSDRSPFISTLMDDFATAWQSLQASPESQVRQREVITKGYDLTVEIRRIAGDIEQIDRDIRTTTESEVANLQAALNRIAVINNQIVSAASNNLPTGDLEDARDNELQKISALVAINVTPTSNNGIVIRTGSGVTLFDARPVTLEYNGTSVNITSTSTPLDVTSRLTGGKLEGLLSFRADTSPAAPSGLPGQEVIRKMRSQINEIAAALTEDLAGPPASFANAYNSGAATGTELASGFFSVTAGFEATTIAVNTGLLNGTNTIKIASIVPTADALRQGGRTFTMTGLNLNNVSYSGLVNGILSNLGQDANQVSDQLSIEQEQSSGLLESLQNRVGVNLDQEILNLQTYQQSYAANARVIAVVNQLFQELEALLR